jgi:hypothetical protein
VDKRIEKLKDLEAVKWVTGCDRQTAEVRRLTAEQLSKIAETEMYQPYSSEPGTWASVKPTAEYSMVMAIVATNYSERGAGLVASGETYTEDQSQGLAIGCYAEQQSRLFQQTGECSEGCSRAQAVVVPRAIKFNTTNATFATLEARQVCRHTLMPCRSCDEMPTAKRIELLERLLISARRLFGGGTVAAYKAIRDIVNELDGAIESVDNIGGKSRESFPSHDGPEPPNPWREVDLG